VGSRRVDDQRSQFDVRDFAERQRRTREDAVSLLSQPPLVRLGAGAERIQPMRRRQHHGRAGGERERPPEGDRVA
jgi:hypothetical protein